MPEEEEESFLPPPAKKDPVEVTPGQIFVALLIQLQEALAHDAEGDWRGFAENLPPVSNSDRFIVCATTEPVNDGTLMVTGRTIQKHGVQVRIDADSEASAYRKAATVRQAVSRAPSQTSLTIGGVVYQVHRAKLTSGPRRLQSTKASRYGYAINYTLALTTDED